MYACMNTKIWQEYSSWRLRRIGRKKDVSRLLTLVMGEGGVTRDLSVSHSLAVQNNAEVHGHDSDSDCEIVLATSYILLHYTPYMYILLNSFS